jgi:hypothetical protein
MPDWHDPSRAIDPACVADAIVSAVARERKTVFVPAATRLLALAHGVSPALADRLLRWRLGRTAAPGGQ